MTLSLPQVRQDLMSLLKLYVKKASMRLTEKALTDEARPPFERRGGTQAQRPVAGSRTLKEPRLDLVCRKGMPPIPRKTTGCPGKAQAPLV